MPEIELAGAAAQVTGASRASAVAAPLGLCRARGATNVYHHYRLVQPFLSVPARLSPPTDG